MKELTKIENGNVQLMNKLNKIKVLNLIRNSGEISRAEIVRQTGLSAPTVTRIVESLTEKDNLVKQVRVGDSSGGRPPILLKFKGESYYVIGIDWGHTHVLGILYNLDGKKLQSIDIPIINNSETLNESLEKIYNLIDDLIAKSKISRTKLRGIGVATAGYINKENSIIEYAPNLKWRMVDLLTPLQNRFGVAVNIMNVSNAMAKGELLYGIGTTCKNFIFIDAGYGLGTGIVSNGEIFYGFDGFAGELGHTRAVATAAGRVCSCGKSDCLECYASGRGIKESCEKQLPYSTSSILYKEANISAKTIADAAKKGDSLAIEVLTQSATILGISVAAMAIIINPEKIILAGKILQPNSYYYRKTKEVIERELLTNMRRQTEVTYSQLEGEAAAKGAMSSILNEILQLKDLENV